MSSRWRSMYALKITGKKTCSTYRSAQLNVVWEGQINITVDRKMLNRVVALKEQGPIDFDWASKPVLVLMRCIGIPLLDMKALRLKYIFFYGLLTLYVLFSYCLNIGSNFGVIFTKSTNLTRDFKTSDWNNIITLQNYVFNVLGIHTALLFFTATHWNALVQAGRRLAHLKAKDFRHIRYACIIGVVILSLVSCY